MYFRINILKVFNQVLENFAFLQVHEHVHKYESICDMVGRPCDTYCNTHVSRRSDFYNIKP